MNKKPSLLSDTNTELTLRGLILGFIITVVFTAANVYFGLKAGLTFATSIPAAVISMAVLRSFKGMTIQENNIVQTVASAAGTLSSIIFVLPGLVMIGWWTGFPYWVSFWICGLGGILGVLPKLLIGAYAIEYVVHQFLKGWFHGVARVPRHAVIRRYD